MKKISLVLLGAGESSRFESGVKKQWIRLDQKPLWLFVADYLSQFYEFSQVIIAVHKNELRICKEMCDYTIVQGGTTRQESLKNALDLVSAEFCLVSDAARAIISKTMFERIIFANGACVVPFLSVVDTAVLGDNYIDRSALKLIQTPQLSKTNLLKNTLLKATKDYTDESSLLKDFGEEIVFVRGDVQARKLTNIQDLRLLNLPKTSAKTFVGYGYDTHQFLENAPLVLGGVEINESYGLKAHSDGDVILHALIDALLGACGFGDIGEFFSDKDEQNKNKNSAIFLKHITDLMQKTSFYVVNVSVVIIAEQPKLSPYKAAIKKSLASLLKIEPFCVNVAATTNEKMGFVGRKEGLMVQCVANVGLIDWGSFTKA